MTGVRFNRCPNPGAKTAVTNWVSNRTITRVTGLTGFERTTGGQITSGGGSGTEYYVVPDRAVASVGQTWTVSISLRASVSLPVNVYLLWIDASGASVISAPAYGQFTATAGQVYRLSVTDVAPVNTAYIGVQATLVGGAGGTDTLTATAALIEPVNAADLYFDGDSTNASWDGTSGNSSSTYTPPSAPTSQTDAGAAQTIQAPTQVPTWRLWVAETRSGRMLWELPAASITWSSVLGDAGTIRATLAIESVYDALSDQNERDPRVLLRSVLSSPWRLSLVLRWGTSVVWAGPLVTYSRQGTTSVDVGGSEVAKLLNRRIMVQNGAISATDPTADLTIGPGSKRRAAYVLLASMLAGTGNDLPLTLTDPGGFGTDQRTYLGSDLATYGEKLKALSAEDDGPEIRYDPVITPGADGDYLTWTVQIGNPHVGADTTIWTFDSSSTVLTEDMDASATAMGFWVPGSGQDRDKLVSHVTNTYLVGLAWPMLETVDTSHSSETAPWRLTSYATADLGAYARPVLARTVRIPAEVDPMPGTYRVGEHFAVDVRGDPIIPDGIFTRRIAGISGDQGAWVTITGTEPLPGVS